MRFRVRKSAHFLERIGLAMAGAACGLFVAAHVGSSIAMLTSQGFIVVMMIAGAIGFTWESIFPRRLFISQMKRPK